MPTVPDEIDREIDRLRRGVARFERLIEELPPGSFLEPLGAWSARDMLVHLIGWTRYVVPGTRQVRRGELPFYDLDPGDDYANVNAELVRTNPSRDPQTLLLDLREAEEELLVYLRSLDPAEWSHDFGVRHRGAPVTVGGTIAELADDFEHHASQLETLAG